jgi:hypothetical protein
MRTLIEDASQACVLPGYGRVDPGSPSATSIPPANRPNRHCLGHHINDSCWFPDGSGLPPPSGNLAAGGLGAEQGSEGGPGRHAELPVDVRQVRLDGPLAQPQRGRDLPVGAAPLD